MGRTVWRACERGHGIADLLTRWRPNDGCRLVEGAYAFKQIAQIVYGDISFMKTKARVRKVCQERLTTEQQRDDNPDF